jgi:hypothetical protein
VSENQFGKLLADLWADLDEPAMLSVFGGALGSDWAWIAGNRLHLSGHGRRTAARICGLT